jgi:translation initiation factor IF-2
VDLLEKVRVYELAKELNTTSKRLMEKLAEINIEVKNHMSLLEEHELKALYKHIGIISHDEKKADAEHKISPPAQPKADNKKEARNAPRIIRTVEIDLDSRNQSRGQTSATGAQRSDFKGSNTRSHGRNRKRDGFKVSEDNSGLRAGFVRDTGFDYKRDMKSFTSDKQSRQNDNKAAPKTEQKQEQKIDAGQNTEAAKKNEVINESKENNVQEVKANQKNLEKAVRQPQTENGQKVKADPGSEHTSNRSSAGQKNLSDHKGAKQESKKHTDASPQSKSQNRGQSRPSTGNRNQERHQARNQQLNKRPQGGEAVASQSNRTQQVNNDKRASNNYRTRQKNLEIPKPELSDAQKDELLSQKSEVRREFQSKDTNKGAKREQKKEISRPVQAGGKTRKFKPQSVILTEKKGISEILSEDFILEEFYDDDGVKRVKKSAKPKRDNKTAKHVPHKAVLTSITISESITVKDLAEALKKTATEVIKKLMALGIMASLNQEVDFDTASIVADEFGVKAEKAVVVNEEDILFDDEEEEDEENLEPRPPVVVVMGHVDHGKTSLLDAIREANVIETEAGGITQHIGAYTVKINGRNITFLDTPGHEAFTAMRARGAQVTDIAILVVAADDGVMPQTIEAINHAKAANISIIVAINKMDKPGANPDRVKQELTEYGLVVEEWGGDVIAVPISAKKRENIDQLLEMVLLTADMMELKANPKRQVKGTIIEAKLDKSRGPIATMLVQRGTLNVGDSIVTGVTVGRIRAMTDDKGRNIKEAGPSTPVEILGLPEVPDAGEVFYAITDEKVARQLVEKRKDKQREEQIKSTARVSLEDLFNQIKEGKVKELNIIVKADVQGSVEAVKQSLEKLSNEEVRINIIHGGVGTITESDVTLAEVSNAIIIGFNIRPAASVTEAAKNADVDIRLYRVIYSAIEDIEAAMKGMLDPTFKEVVLGHTEVRQIFKASGIGTIGGCYVLDGKIIRNSDIRVVRDGIVIHEGKLASLKRFKDDVKEVVQGFECGLSIERFNDIKEGDVIESYMMEEVKRD